MTTASHDFRFANAHRFVTDSTKLSSLKSQVDSIASDIATLDAQTEAQRKTNADLRNTVLEKFQRLAET